MDYGCETEKAKSRRLDGFFEGDFEYWFVLHVVLIHEVEALAFHEHGERKVG